MKRLCLILFLVSALSCRRQTGQHLPVEATRFMMDTAVRIAVYDPTLSRDDAENAIMRAFRMMESVEAKVSAHIPGNEISKLNAGAGGAFQTISDETALLFQTSRVVADETGGAFDVTIGPVKDLWPFDTESPSVPDSTAIRERLSLVDYRRIELSDHQACLARPGMGVDFGGIGKGLNVDLAVKVLQEAGVRSGIVDAGGNLRIFGKHPQNTHWRIGVKHPRPDKNSLYAVIETDSVSISTSGDYERFFMVGGQRYHHILDPKTGYPARGCVSVTIITESAMVADAYSTAVFVLGPTEGMKLIERLPELEGMIIFEKNGRLEHWVSNGLQSKARFFQ
jgi:thiamine biosynthesis lipoprotein